MSKYLIIPNHRPVEQGEELITVEHPSGYSQAALRKASPELQARGLHGDVQATVIDTERGIAYRRRVVLEAIEEKPDYKAALAVSNAIITGHGGTAVDKLEPGAVKSGPSCAISRTIQKGLPEASVVTSTKVAQVDGASYVLPPQAVEFVRAFDRGDYPTLVA